MDTVLVSLKGGLLMKVGESGFEEGSGDSGGPIVSADDGKVLAITAWSAGAGHGSRCGALTQGALVAPQRAWIDAVLNRWSGQ